MKASKVTITTVVVLLVCGVATADTLWVDPGGVCGGNAPCYTTIGAALADAGTVTTPPDTINVGAGTYAETLALLEPEHNDITVQGDATKPTITVGVTMEGGLTNPTLRSLHLTGVASGAADKIIGIGAAVSGFTMDQCIMDGENVSGRHGLGNGSLVGDVTVTDNEFKDVLNWALFESRSGSGGGGSLLGTVIFTGNNIHNCNGTVVFRGDETSAPASYTTSVTIANNTWQTIGGNQGETGFQWAAFEVNRAKVVVIDNNTVDDVNKGAYGEGQAGQVWNISTSLTVTNNLFTNNEQGIWFASVAEDPGSFGTFSNNCFLNNGDWGLKVEPGVTNPVNAENNWWGNATGPSGVGPGTGDAILDAAALVDFTPHLTACGPLGIPMVGTIGVLALLAGLGGLVAYRRRHA